MHTLVWINSENGHQYVDDGGKKLLNGRPVDEVPLWALGRQANRIFGEPIAWFGGECPVEPHRLVRCLFRGRLPYVGEAIWPSLPEDAKEAMWQHAPYGRRTDPKADIIAYQLEVIL